MLNVAKAVYLQKIKRKPYVAYLVELFKVVFNRNATLYCSHRFMKFLPGVLSIIIW